MADAIDVLLQAANASKERRQATIDTQNKTTTTMIDALQRNRQLDIMQQTANTGVDELSLKREKLDIERMKAEQSSQLLNQFLAQGTSGAGGLPPGTTFSKGGLTIPLNQKLTDSEQSSIAGADKFEPLVKNIETLINEGTLGKSGGLLENAKRTGKQLLAETGDNPVSRLITEDDSNLEKLSSAAAEMKKFAFQEGGKTLSKTEKKIVSAGLSFVGKSDAQIKADFSAAIDILRQKKLLAVGGADAVNKTVVKEIAEGTRGTAKDGTPVVRKGGKWVAA